MYRSLYLQTIYKDYNASKMTIIR